MYPKLGAIPTPTGEEGEAGEPDKLPNEYADEGQKHHMSICKKLVHSCSMRGIAVSTILIVTTIVGGGFLYRHLINTPSSSPADQGTGDPVPEPVKVMFDFSLK